MQFEFSIELIRTEKNILIICCLLVVKRTGRIIVYFYQLLVW